MKSIFARFGKGQEPQDPKAENERLKAAIEAVFDRINDPVTGKPIAAAGLVDGLTVKDGHAAFSIATSQEDAAARESVRAEAEAAVRNLDGIENVTAVLTAHQAERQTPPPPQAGASPQDRIIPLPGVKAVIAVASGKGGVGKSTVAANLAATLAARGMKIGLLDADIYGPSVPTLFGIHNRPDMKDEKNLDPHVVHGVKIMSMGFMVDQETPMIWRGPIVMSAIAQMLRDVDWGELDILFVDMPPGTGDAQLTMAQKVALTGAVIVSTPQELALADARRGIAMFDKTHVPILGVVENMAYFVSPETKEKTYIFGQGGAKAAADAAGAPFLGELPLYPDLRAASDAGAPLAATKPDAPAAQDIARLANNLMKNLEAATGARKPPRIVILD